MLKVWVLNMVHFILNFIILIFILYSLLFHYEYLFLTLILFIILMIFLFINYYSLFIKFQHFLIPAVILLNHFSINLINCKFHFTIHYFSISNIIIKLKYDLNYYLFNKQSLLTENFGCSIIYSNYY